MVTDFYKKFEASFVNMHKTHLFFLSGIKGFSEHRYKKWIIENYSTDLALIDDNFLIKKLYHKTTQKTNDLRGMIINEIKDKKIIYLDNVCEFNDDLLVPLLTIINYCINYEKKIFVISELKFPGNNLYEKYNTWRNTLIKKTSNGLYDIIQVKPLNRREMQIHLQQLDRDNKIKNIDCLIDYSFNNSIALELLVSALKEHNIYDTDAVLSEELIVEALEEFYKAIIDSLDQTLRQILLYAAAIGYEIYVSFMDTFHIKNAELKLNQIKDQTRLIRASKNVDEFDFIFNDNVVFSVTLKQLSQDSLKSYSLRLSKKVIELLNSNETISRIKLLELLIRYEKFSENEIYKNNAVKELLKEYCNRGLYDTCLNYIDENKIIVDGVEEIKLECIFGLNNFSDCINIINSKRGKTNNERYILATSYYRLGFPQKAIHILKPLCNKKENINGSILLLMASSYEWLCDKQKYIKFFNLALKNLSLNKPKEYYTLLRKCNMVIDSDLPIFDNYYLEAIKYFKQHDLFIELAWTYHNYATSKLLALDNIEVAFDNLNEALQLLVSAYKMDILDVKNSLGLYYALKLDWKNAKKQFIDSYNKHEVLFCNIANKLNLATAYRKLNDFTNFECMLSEVDQLISKNKHNKSILLPKQAYLYNKGILCRLKKDNEQALTYFEQALKILPQEYDSYYYLPIANEVLKMSLKIDTNPKLIKLAQKYSLTLDKLSNFYLKNDLILSEIMFWN
jgi:hypothetical protein